MTYLTTEQVAKKLKVSVPTIHQWVKAGLEPTIRVGRSFGWELAKVQQWAIANAKGPWRRPGSGGGRPTSATHGTRSRYNAGCRCVDCKAANAAYMRERAAKERKV